MGTTTPHTMSSYSRQLVGMTPVLASTMASTMAMMEPETREAHRYLCSSQTARATQTHITPSSPQMSSP